MGRRVNLDLIFCKMCQWKHEPKFPNKILCIQLEKSLFYGFLQVVTDGGNAINIPNSKVNLHLT